LFSLPCRRGRKKEGKWRKKGGISSTQTAWPWEKEDTSYSPSKINEGPLSEKKEGRRKKISQAGAWGGKRTRLVRPQIKEKKRRSRARKLVR